MAEPTRCPVCGTATDWASHDTEFCRNFHADILAATELAKTLDLPTDSAARLVGSIGTEIPHPARGKAVEAALTAWAEWS